LSSRPGKPLGNQIPLPANLVLQLCKQGAIFRFTVVLGKKKSPRYLIIVNVDPMKDGEILVVTTTTKLQASWVRTRRKNTIVSVPKSRSFFPRDSIIDCNSLSAVLLGNLTETISSDPEFKYIGEISAVLLKDILKAIKASPLVTPREKLRILGSNVKTQNPPKKKPPQKRKKN
jgi:hypothetical protein